MEWLSGWGHRKVNPIKGTTAGAQTNYQKRMTVHKGSGEDTETDVYCGGNCRDDFGDIRWTEDDGTTLMDYWIEELASGDYAVFWIEIPSVPASPNTVDVYMYYDKSDATSVSSGDDTFPFFDDFPGTSIDTSKWDTIDSGMTYSVSNSLLHVTGCPNDTWKQKRGFHHSSMPLQDSFKVRLIDVKWDDGGSNSPLYGWGVILGNTGGWDYQLSEQVVDAWSAQRGEKQARIGSQYYRSGYNTLAHTGTAQSEITKDQSDNVEIYWDGASVLGPYSDTVTLTEMVLLVNKFTSAYPFASEVSVDTIILQKYVSPEPTWGAWGEEETPPPPPVVGKPPMTLMGV